MAEWTNPIFYLNLAGFVLSALLLVRRRGTLARPWVLALWILAVGTGLHFVGDLAGASEDLDHIFIHGIVALALVPPAIHAIRAA